MKSHQPVLGMLSDVLGLAPHTSMVETKERLATFFANLTPGGFAHVVLADINSPANVTLFFSEGVFAEASRDGFLDDDVRLDDATERDLRSLGWHAPGERVIGMRTPQLSNWWRRFPRPVDVHALATVLMDTMAALDGDVRSLWLRYGGRVGAQA